MRFLGAGLALLLSISAAAAAECGPDKLGTSRVVAVGTEGGLEVGLKTYPQSVPLADHEVILTFDDGPDARTTPEVLKALADECVLATFFVIGRDVEAQPQLARREVLDGHTVAHHTFSHPQPTLRFLPPAIARADILKGMIAIEKAAYGATFPDGEPKDLAGLRLHTPFFRYPGFADTADLDAWFAANNVAVFGVDLWASDWIKMTPEQELKLILGRLERTHKGMLLFHDNHPWTAAMVPMLLRELKTRGYRVVHMVAGPGRLATEPAPRGWVSETGRIVEARKTQLQRPGGLTNDYPAAAAPAR